MQKIKKIAIILLSVLVMIGICSCNEEKEIRDDIVNAYGLDNYGKNCIIRLFKKIDNEFLKLEKADKITDIDLYNYADAIDDAYSDFSERFESYSENLKDRITEVDGKTKDIYIEILAEESSLTLKSMSLTTGRLDYMSGNESGKILFEETVNFINKASEFFYGKSRLPADAIDELSDKFV